MSIRLMTAVWDADLSKVEWIIAAHVAPATKTRPERLMPPEKGMLSAMDKSVLLALADHAADDGSSVYPSIATLAYKTELSERTVREALRHLETAGLIEQEKKPSQHRSAHYRLIPDKIRAARRAGLKDDPRPARGAGQRNEPDRHVAPPNHQESKSKANTRESTSTSNHQEAESKTKNGHAFGATLPQPGLDSLFAHHHEQQAAADVEAPLRDGGRDRARATKGSGESPRGGATPASLKLQQLVTDKLREKFFTCAPDFCRGEGIWSDLFRAVGELGITLAEAVAVVEEVEGADALDFFDHTGEPLCTAAERVEEILWEVRCQNQERDTLPAAPRLGAAGEE
jgi:hypothetical protein